ncbi:MAG: carboxylating nicotinate-nucleotide diphosphorylase [Deltaproteobacteria bacterium]|nr:MAG: carboxylating nicotinate-nucleotide diphosphorylase [Deltaproteobacteria bacterium]
MQLAELVRHALAEDVGHRDVTTEATVPADRRGQAEIRAKQELVVCGHEPAAEVFRQVGARYTIEVAEGQRVEPGAVIARVDGSLRAMLIGERLALNFLMRLSGIATHTSQTVSAAPDLRVVDTRKTTPLHRALERHAVRVGGGGNHRFALYDGILIKDNHIAAAGGIAAAVAAARAFAHHLLRIEIEVGDLHELRQALEAGVDAVLLDNMDDDRIAEALAIVRSWQDGGQGRVLVEASGNMDAARLPALARLGVDLVSIGGLIHQATWADLSMKIAMVTA